MQAIEVRGEVRTAIGKGNARRARAAGKIPGVIYGSSDQTLSVSLDSKQLDKILQKRSSGTFILDLKLAGREDQEMKAIIKDLQRHPLSSAILHVDLLHISMTQQIVVHVPVHLTGTPVGVKEGGVLEHFTREVEIQCLPSQIPDGITIEVGHLSRGHSVHVSDLLAPEGVTILTPADRVVAGVIVTKVVEVAPPPTAEAAEGAPTEEKGEEASGKKKGEEPAGKKKGEESPAKKKGEEPTAKS